MGERVHDRDRESESYQKFRLCSYVAGTFFPAKSHLTHIANVQFVVK